jgi:tetratricopeptide (TPR) repeat protein
MSWNRKKILLAGTAIVAACVGGVVWFYVWPQYLFKRAEQAIAANDLARAEEALQRLNQRDPQNGRVRFLLAQVFRRRQRPDKAEEALRQARQLGYPESECQRELVLNEAVIDFTPATAEALIKFLNDKPDDEEILQALAEGYVRLALAEGYVRLQLQHWTEAERYLTRLIEQHPEKVEAWFQRGQVRWAAKAFERDQNNDQAAADFREVIRRVPDHFEARLKLAECLLNDAHIASAKRELLICRQLNPTHTRPLIGLAICAMEEQDLEQAQVLVAQALNREPNSLMALSMQGDLCLRRKEYMDAIRFYQRLLSLDPAANKAVHLKLAQAFRHSGRLEDAKNEEARFQQLRQSEKKTLRPFEK